jgi:hypothetical protein
LTNRAEGMAPGYKFSTMSYNPLDIIDACKEYISTGKIKTLIRPYIPNIKQDNWKYDSSTNTWTNYGEWKYNKSKDIMTITDLPYDVDFDSFEKLLNKFVETGYIKEWKNLSEGNNICYNVQFPKKQLEKEIGRASVDTKIPNKFGLIKKMPDDLLWVLDENKKIRHFKHINEILTYFTDYRLNFYNLRKSKLVELLKEKIVDNDNLCKFIELIITGKIEIRNKKRSEIKEKLKPYNLPDSLLSYPMSKLTKEEYNDLIKQNKEIKKELEYIQNTTIKTMYLNDLKELRKKLEPDFITDK